MHDSLAVANELIRCGIESGRLLTHMQVQKLVYFAHARKLGIHGEPLVREYFEAWRHGPVIPKIYHALKSNRWAPISDVIEVQGETNFPSIDVDIIKWAFNEYSYLDAFELSDITHNEGSPWLKTMPGGLISNDSIERYSAKYLKEEAEKTLRLLLGNHYVQQQTAEGLDQLKRGEVTPLDEVISKMSGG